MEHTHLLAQNLAGALVVVTTAFVGALALATILVQCWTLLVWALLLTSELSKPLPSWARIHPLAAFHSTPQGEYVQRPSLKSLGITMAVSLLASAFLLAMGALWLRTLGPTQGPLS